jgi:exodeoxyribonuclease V alpha subunit
VRTDARLVLLGDPDQLESVDRGRVLGDVVQASEHVSSPLHGHVVRLLRSHRYGGDSAVAQLANAVRNNDPTVATTPSLTGSTGGTVTFLATGEPLSAAAVDAARHEVEPHLLAMRAAADAGDALEALAAGSRVRMLCAHREGPYGVSEWNDLGEQWLRGAQGGPSWYAGKPLLATRNDARLGIANGDTGVVVRQGAQLLAAFQTGQGLQLFEQAQLSDIDTAYAITVHKSQGSEYDTVVVILPPVDSPLVSRELVYTAVTRAKQRVFTIGTAAAMIACLDTPARRMTGLTEALTT